MKDDNDSTPDHQEIFDVEQFICGYKWFLKESTEGNVSYPYSIPIFLKQCLVSFKWTEIVEGFNTLLKNEGESVGCLFALGYCYFTKATNEIKAIISKKRYFDFYVNWNEENFKSAIFYFQKAKKIDNNSVTSAWLAFCYSAIGAYNKAEYYLEKIGSKKLNKEEENFVNHISSLGEQFMRDKGADICLMKHKFDEALRILDGDKIFIYLNENKNKQLPPFLAFLLFRAYSGKNFKNKALFFIKQWKKYESDYPLVYDLAGREYVKYGMYRQSYLYFSKAIKLYKDNFFRRVECEILCEFCLGMSLLQKYYSAECKKHNEPLGHFFKCSNLIETYRMKKVGYRNFNALKDLASITERICGFAAFDKLADVTIQCRHVMENMYVLSSIYCFYPFSIPGRIDKLPNLINLLFFIRFTYLLYLSSILEGRSIDKMSFDKVTQIHRNILEKLNFKDDALAFENLGIFKEKFGERPIDNIPKQEQLTLLNILTSGFKTSGEASSYKETEATFNISGKPKEGQEILFIKLENIVDAVEKVGIDLKVFGDKLEPRIEEITKKVEIIPKIPEVFTTKIEGLEKAIKEGGGFKMLTETPEIIFGPIQVRFRTKEKEETYFRDNQPMKLLEYFILKGQLHYLYGYIIFQEWRHRSFEDPKREWVDVKSKLVGPKKGIFKQCNLALKIESTLIDPDVDELIGPCASNLDYLKEIFSQDSRIDNFYEKLKQLSQKDVKGFKNFLMQKLNDYDNGIRMISEQKNTIKIWDDSAANAFERIKSEKEVFINILQKCFSIAVPEQSETDKIEAFETCKSFIEFVKKFDIDGLGEDRLIKEISEDITYLSIWDDILKTLYKKNEIETKTEENAIIRIIINVIRETELVWQKFETKEGLINYLCSKTKRRLRQNRNPKDKDQIRYERSSNDFNKAIDELLSNPGQVLTNERIAKKLISDYEWTAKRYWDFLALKEFVEKQKPHDEESDKMKGRDDDASTEDH